MLFVFLKCLETEMCCNKGKMNIYNQFLVFLLQLFHVMCIVEEIIPKTYGSEL